MEKTELDKKVKKDDAPRIGLFWFSQDYTKIIKIEGELEISSEDLLKPGRLDPIGVHAEFDMPKNVPRGRVNYENNVFRVWVGEDCFVEDEKLIILIKDYFNLINIDSGKFTVKKHYHWNTKV